MRATPFLSIIAGIAIAGVVQAQSETVPGATQDQPQPATKQTEGTAADRTPPGATPTRDVPAGTVNPVPATSRTEGTAADRTPPGETPVRGAAADQAPDAVTQSMRMATAEAEKMGGHRASRLIGTSVHGPDGKPIGEVKDVVIGARGAMDHLIISHGGTAGEVAKLTAVPLSAAKAMMRGERLTIEQSRLEQAPSFAAEQWPNLATQDWSVPADEYWNAHKSTAPASGAASADAQ